MFYRRKLNVKDENPVVFIPGLFGSMGRDIIPGTGDFDFGMSEYIYRPLIDNLEDMGYKEGKDLFVAYYDWRKKNIYSAEKYLIPVIKKAKDTTGKHKVNLICHSMGGIVARSYIQTQLYKHDVQKLIMIGTPNCGSINAYYFWSGGMLPYDKIENNVFYRLLKAGFLWIFKLIHGTRCNLEILRGLFPVVEELLPSYENGDYLIFKEDNKLDRYIPISKMSIRNDLLNSLNKKANLIYRYGIKTYLIVGSSVKTNYQIYVKNFNSNCNTWKDGKPLHSVETLYGDGTVTCKSAQSFAGRIKYINGDHMNILTDSKEIIANILMRKTEESNMRIEKDRAAKIYSILADNISEIQITVDNKKISINKGKFTVNDSYIVRKVGENIYWVMLKSITENEIDLKIYPEKAKESHVLILCGEKNNKITKISDKTIKSKLVLTL